MKSLVCLSCILILAFLISCKRTVLVNDTSQCDTVVFKYADHISIVKYSNYSIVELKDPWKKDRILHRYVLVNRADSANIRNKSIVGPSIAHFFQLCAKVASVCIPHTGRRFPRTSG